MELFNKDTFMGKWKEIKGEIRKKWGQLTDDELEKTKGDMTAIGGLIQQKYGAKKEEVKEKIESIFKNFQESHKERSA